jgi:hypothetical protein
MCGAGLMRSAEHSEGQVSNHDLPCMRAAIRSSLAREGVSGTAGVTRGLGLSMLDAISERWSLKPGRHGTALRVELLAVLA